MTPLEAHYVDISKPLYWLYWKPMVCPRVQFSTLHNNNALYFYSLSKPFHIITKYYPLAVLRC